MEARFPESADKLIELFDKVVDETLVFVRKECKENIVSVDINLTNSFCNLLEAFLRDAYGVKSDNFDFMLPQYFSFCYIWVFGGNLHDSSLAKFDTFARGLLNDAINASLPPSATVWDYKVDAETGSWVKWDVPVFGYIKNTAFFNLVVPTVDSTRLKYVIKADIEGGFHVLIGGTSGVGKTLTILDYLDNAGDEYVYQAKTFSAQTSARALQAFFEEKLEKIRKVSSFGFRD